MTGLGFFCGSESESYHRPPRIPSSSYSDENEEDTEGSKEMEMESDDWLTRGNEIEEKGALKGTRDSKEDQVEPVVAESRHDQRLWRRRFP